jgi:crotonobetainyl-CoA:carnitine CoA-transferase CaiB-like acyl-CoA transferase
MFALRIVAALFDVMTAVLANQALNYLVSGNVPRRLGNAHPNIVPYQVFPVADGHVMLAVGNDRQFATFAGLVGRPELATDPRFATNTARVAHRDVVRTMMEERLVTEGADHWYAELTKVGVPCGPINDLATAFGLATELGLNPIVHVEGSPTPLVANPVHMSETPPSYRLAPPVMPTLSGSADG